ncbi:MAG TPA: DUF4160 domain-containing protein [Ktedonobacteraceae bacterium]|nr:DUF4160 domain-containing protein [Ktedonobacteraceae bacterium]
MGIIIYMYYNDHLPPHFHAKSAEHEALIRIDTLAVLRGELPKRESAYVLKWAKLHREELKNNWERARQGLPLLSIAPLE